MFIYIWQKYEYFFDHFSTEMTEEGQDEHTSSNSQIPRFAAFLAKKKAEKTAVTPGKNFIYLFHWCLCWRIFHLCYGTHEYANGLGLKKLSILIQA